MDFTLKTYKILLNTLKQQGFSFQTFDEFLELSEAVSRAKRVTIPDKVIILRHDVDKLPENSLHFAQIQHKLGIKGTYFFRIVPESFNPKIIKEIAKLGHEIGYHYEDIDLASKAAKNLETRNQELETEKHLVEHAIQLFNKHLEELRKIASITTICMHGSPLSKYDNKLLWKYYNYKDFGIVGEPYFDIDFSKVLYLTDTGRKWNGEKVSIRDKVSEKASPLGDRGASAGKMSNFKNTKDIISAAQQGKLPDQIMFTFHPQRWTDKPLPWIKELVWQNVKNVLKYCLNLSRNM